MTLFHSTLALGLAWFAAVNLLAAMLVMPLASRVRRPHAILLRLAPPTIAALFTTLVFVPGHILFEAGGNDERLGLTIYALAALTVVLVIRGAWRAFGVLHTGRALARVNESASISLAGILRPRILIGQQAREALSPAELDVAIAHERAHEAARDNLLRFVMYCAPDAFGLTRAAASLENAWRAEAEHRADATAVSGDRHRAAMLASALIKVARLDVAGRRSPVWSSFHEPSLLESRVRALLADEIPAHRSSRESWRIAMALLLGAAAAWFTGAAVQLHHATERLIASLP